MNDKAREELRDVLAPVIGHAMLRAAELEAENPDRRDSTNRERWSDLGLNGDAWIEDPHDRTNYLLNEWERLYALADAMRPLPPTDCGAAIAYINDHFKGEFSAGQDPAKVMIELLSELRGIRGLVEVTGRDPSA